MTPNEKPASPTQALIERMRDQAKRFETIIIYKADVELIASALDRTTLPPTEDMVLVPKTALDWLFGEGPDDDGIWFGDAERFAGSGAFWWRTVFRRLISGRLALTSGSKPE